MNATWVAVGLVVLFAATSLATDLLPRRWRAAPPFLLALLFGWFFFELRRYDLGFGDLLFWAAMVVAPVVAIFGGAAWGTKRFYGWPDFGSHPPRAALVALGILVGVMVGTRQKDEDLRASEALVEAWARGGRAQGRPPPVTRMGRLAPPAVVANEASASFPIGGGLHRVLDIERGTWRTERAAPSGAGAAGS